MAGLTYSKWPPRLDEAREEGIVKAIEAKGLALEFAVKPKNSEQQDACALAPITIFPSLFPKNCFRCAHDVQPVYNFLYAQISANEAWLERHIKPLIRIDDFIARLWSIHDRLKNSYLHTVSMGVFRSDYMVNIATSTSKPIIKQVEFNTIATSFAVLSSRATLIHQACFNESLYGPFNQPGDLPRNTAIPEMAIGFQKAIELYQARFPPPRVLRHALCVLFVVQENESNIYDQTHLATDLRNLGIPVFRLTLAEIESQILVDWNGALIYKKSDDSDKIHEIAVVYYRAGYDPREYASEREWQAREYLEASRAIKCPSVLSHLAGLKKVQQILATSPSEMDLAARSELALTDDLKTMDTMWPALRETFVSMYPLDEHSSEGQEGRRLALDPVSAQRFVLKPQREGGGNNIYRDDIPGFLQSIPKDQWEAYILMQMIETPQNQTNTILRNGKTQTGSVICELGIFGVCLWEKTVDATGKPRIVLHANANAGHLLRTKGSGDNEGGVAAGFGALDSPLLVEDDAVFH